MGEISHYNAKIYSVYNAGSVSKPNKTIIRNSKSSAKTSEQAIKDCLSKLPKSYAKKRVVLVVTPCETVNNGVYSMELALVARTDFVTITP